MAEKTLGIQLNVEEMKTAFGGAVEGAVKAAMDSYDTRQQLTQSIADAGLSDALASAVKTAIELVDVGELTRAIAAEMTRAMAKTMSHAIQDTAVEIAARLRGIPDYGDGPDQKRRLRAEMFGAKS